MRSLKSKLAMSLILSTGMCITLLFTGVLSTQAKAVSSLDLKEIRGGACQDLSWDTDLCSSANDGCEEWPSGTSYTLTFSGVTAYYLNPGTDLADSVEVDTPQECCDFEEHMGDCNSTVVDSGPCSDFPPGVFPQVNTNFTTLVLCP